MICGRSALRLCSRSARRPIGGAQCRGQHVPRSAEDLDLVDLRDAEPAILEDDRDLADREPRVVHAPDHLLQKGVTRRAHVERLDPLEHGAAVAAEARGAVAHGYAEQHAGVEVREAREQAPAPRPVGHAAARDIARPDHQVGLCRGFQHVRQVARMVAVIAVHRDHAVVALVERVAEAGEIRRAEPELPRAAQERQARLVTARCRNQVARSVRAVVVHDEHVDALVLRQHVGGKRDHVLRLVVGRQDDERSHEAAQDTGIQSVRPSSGARSRRGGSPARPGARQETTLPGAPVRRLTARGGAGR
jgi:hypothetical protein